MFATPGKCADTKPASTLFCSLSVLAAFFLLFALYFIFLPNKKGPLLMEGAFFSQLQFNYVDCLGAFRAFFSIKADSVAFSKALKAIALD